MTFRLDGTAFAKWAGRFAAYAEGKAPLELRPVGGGTAVPFVHDGQPVGAVPTEAGWHTTSILDVRVRAALSVGDLYNYDGATWQVAPVDDREVLSKDVLAGADWAFGARLVRHAA